jgi:hypothetical protein
MAYYIQHPSGDVREALEQLINALGSWEKSTGVRSVLILREQGGFVYRAVNGSTDVPDDIEDTQLLKIVEDK